MFDWDFGRSGVPPAEIKARSFFDSARRVSFDLKFGNTMEHTRHHGQALGSCSRGRELSDGQVIFLTVFTGICYYRAAFGQGTQAFTGIGLQQHLRETSQVRSFKNEVRKLRK
jgi:hypothetical protein